jgi:diaminohydroxyphosphoribosylaminopyrimidine deaminase/5-amino-6-(5-phosphoribosylamino)uracil reductase
MRRAVTLARRGEGYVNPNPLVGAVIVKNGVVTGEGWHKKYGSLHAERDAIFNAGIAGCRGADLYVTLEPCCHTGKQPPCTELIISSGIARVFAGSRDPNPLVSGKGFSALENAGITVFKDVLRNECDALNPVFFHFITTGTPYVIMKYAMTADGLTACHTGDSRWVSGQKSREFVHSERAQYMAVMTGIQTVLRDDPLLTSRLPGIQKYGTVRQPVRIVCDSGLRLPVESRLVQTAGEAPLLIACTLNEAELAESAKAADLKKLGAELIPAGQKNGHVDLCSLMQILGRRNIDSILMEGGGTLNYSALESGIVSKLQVFIAPKLFGSDSRKYTPLTGKGAEYPDKAFMLQKPAIRTFGNDVMLEYTMPR